MIKKGCFIFLSLLVMFQLKAFGLYGPTNDIDAESEKHFDSPIHSQKIPVFLFNNKENYCAIPLDEQSANNQWIQENFNKGFFETERLAFQSLLITEDLTQNFLWASISHEPIKDVKICEPNTTQAILDSINTKNQLAGPPVPIVLGVIYVGFCFIDYGITINSKSFKRSKSAIHPKKQAEKSPFGPICLPFYHAVHILTK